MQHVATEIPAVGRVAWPGGDGNRARHPVRSRVGNRLPRPLGHPAPEIGEELFSFFKAQHSPMRNEPNVAKIKHLVWNLCDFLHELNDLEQATRHKTVNCFAVSPTAPLIFK